MNPSTSFKDLFSVALNKYNESKNPTGQGDGMSRSQEEQGEQCEHPTLIDVKGAKTCLNCGIIVETPVQYSKEWRSYKGKSKDPTRVQARKTDEKNIFKDVQGLGFSEKIVCMANDLYNNVAKGNIYRGNSRRSIIFACIFHAYKSSGKPQTHEKLIKLFKLNRKSGLKGLKHVTLNSTSPIVKTGRITAKHLICDIMCNFQATKEQKEEVIHLHSLIKNRSSNLNRARPNSIAAGLIFYWIQEKKKNISIKEFAVKTGLSEITILKISKEIATILKRKNNQRPKAVA